MIRIFEDNRIYRALTAEFRVIDPHSSRDSLHRRCWSPDGRYIAALRIPAMIEDFDNAGIQTIQHVACILTGRF